MSQALPHRLVVPAQNLRNLLVGAALAERPAHPLRESRLQRAPARVGIWEPSRDLGLGRLELQDVETCRDASQLALPDLLTQGSFEQHLPQPLVTDQGSAQPKLIFEGWKRLESIGIT